MEIRSTENKWFLYKNERKKNERKKIVEHELMKQETNISAQLFEKNKTDNAPAKLIKNKKGEKYRLSV